MRLQVVARDDVARRAQRRRLHRELRVREQLDDARVQALVAPHHPDQQPGLELDRAWGLRAGDVEAALLDANLGMTPNNDGEIIRLNIPQLTEDRRKDVAKEAKAVGEEAKVAVRSTRKKANDSVKKKGKDLSEDVAKDAQDQIQKLTDKLVKEIDALVAKKEKEVMTV